MPNTLDPHHYLKAIITREFKSCGKQDGALSDRNPLVITISRDYGAGGEEVARKLADCLSIPLYDQELSLIHI